jgi:hypothetical protein
MADSDRDCIFAGLVVTVLMVLFFRISFMTFVFCNLLFFGTAELLSYKIRLMPSFYISLVLAVLSIALIVSD